MAPDLEKQPDVVAAMFDQVAEHYDLTDSVLTFGLERWWRRQLRRQLHRQLGPGSDKLVLDLAAGTGTSSAAIAKTIDKVVACDFSQGMVRQGQRRLGGTGVAFVGGDATKLPFADAVFSAVTISFGLRNVVDVPRALAEMRRVTQPGGQLIVLEFSSPPSRLLRWGYHLYLTRILPLLVKIVTPHHQPYRYLTESIKAWHSQVELAHQIEIAGWQTVDWRDLTGGVVTLHTAQAPAYDL
ncbi:MAG: ubiquinone/menaquinone biosynthesis methyltransferase [Micrococcales bacterium]|nr:ubiquinone/menaquinone biosynthesis methyltransferase [Micrococcales bacterium]